MASILVDYENIHASQGMKGVELLNSDDRLYIFYSDCCDKIKTEYMEKILESGCDFDVIKLANKGKNALDFYIAAECGVISQRGESQIAIVSNDKGFNAVVDYFNNHLGNQRIKVVKASTIELGLVGLDDDNNKERRRKIHHDNEMLDLAEECVKYKERIRMLTEINKALAGTEFESIVPEVIRFVDANRTTGAKQMYTGALHTFGKEKGLELYKYLKQVI